MSNNGNDKRFIEDFLPIQAISAEASREKSVLLTTTSGTRHSNWQKPIGFMKCGIRLEILPSWYASITPWPSWTMPRGRSRHRGFYEITTETIAKCGSH